MITENCRTDEVRRTNVHCPRWLKKRILKNLRKTAESDLNPILRKRAAEILSSINRTGPIASAADAKRDPPKTVSTPVEMVPSPQEVRRSRISAFKTWVLAVLHPFRAVGRGIALASGSVFVGSHSKLSANQTKAT